MHTKRTIIHIKKIITRLYGFICIAVKAKKRALKVSTDLIRRVYQLKPRTKSYGVQFPQVFTAHEKLGMRNVIQKVEWKN